MIWYYIYTHATPNELINLKPIDEVYFIYEFFFFFLKLSECFFVRQNVIYKQLSVREYNPYQLNFKRKFIYTRISRT